MSYATRPDNQTPLTVVIVNYRTPGLTIDCLRSLESEVRSRFQELAWSLTDNDSRRWVS
jgi:GT2 family glycosyltransferase